MPAYHQMDPIALAAVRHSDQGANAVNNAATARTARNSHSASTTGNGRRVAWPYRDIDKGTSGTTSTAMQCEPAKPQTGGTGSRIHFGQLTAAAQVAEHRGRESQRKPGNESPNVE